MFTLTNLGQKLNSSWMTGSLIVILSLALAWGLWRVYQLESNQSAVVIENQTANQIGAWSASSTPSSAGSGEVVASKNSDKYHYPWCSGAKRIKAVNLIKFANISLARAAGYLPASNCPGLN